MEQQADYTNLAVPQTLSLSALSETFASQSFFALELS